jgi:GR25 family glycosyltransferase involved in LPS biosynthesis
MFALGGVDTKNFPVVIGDEPRAPVPVSVAPAPTLAPVTNITVEVPHMITCATRKYLPSLQHWLASIAAQKGGMPELKATIFLSSDIPDDTIKALKEKFSFAEFEALPDTVAPADSFADFWEPQHFGWKLWILNEMCGRLPGQMMMYTDAGSFLCRWPKNWMLAAQAAGLCLLEDPREENRRWCSPEFCAALRPTEAELSAQQRLGGLVAFRAGSPLATAVFSEALGLGKRREVLVGPKWAGVGPDGKPFGHRHDQSILSIVSLRHAAPAQPLDTVYCDISLRKTFTSGRAIYVHRGDFQVHRQFSERIDEAYVINLDRRTDRMERLDPEIRARAERWSAIDGRNLQLTPAIQRLLQPNDFFWKKAVSGCALSHLGLWWKLARENPDIENYLILEDDVKFRPGWEAAWKAAAADIPDDYDIIYLGGVLPPNRASFENDTKERFNKSFCRIKENTSWGQKTPTRYFHFCAYAYVLSKRGAEKIIDLINMSKGYWTSADHILCNPVSVLRSYILDPMVAGCYQDDDPKYANSQFNDFSRIDGFDSDLWNNDERFTVDSEIGGELDIERALKDARGAPATEPKPLKAEEPPKELAVAKCEGKPYRKFPKRFVCLSDHDLTFNKLYEYEWLMDLFGRPSAVTLDKIRPDAPPPTDAPIVILQRPWVDIATGMLEKWDSFGAKFSILHLSDEFGTDDLAAYSLAGCEKVLRFYQRAETPKATTIPLGFHWTLAEGSKNMLTLTPRLPFRSLTWSFFGTDWNGRGQQLKPLYDISGRYDCQLFNSWNDPGALPKDKYISTLLDTVFVPCPDGINAETFRFYEALECGCIPLLVRTDANATWVDSVCENLQILPFSSWTEAAKVVEHLMKEKTMLEAYRTKVLQGWIDWRLRLQTETMAWLSS